MKSEICNFESFRTRLMGNLEIGDHFILPSRVLHSEWGTFVTESFTGVVDSFIEAVDGKTITVMVHSMDNRDIVKYLCPDLVVLAI